MSSFEGLGDTKEVDLVCPKHGTVQATVLHLFTGWTDPRCPNCFVENEQAEKAEETRRKAETQARQLEEQGRQAFERSGIPERFRECSFTNYRAMDRDQQKNLAACSQYAARFPELASKGTSLILFGNTGTGKTHLACAIARHIALEHHRTVLYTTAAKALREVKETYRKGSDESEGDAIRWFTRPKLLIIDEIGVQYGSDAENNILFEIVNDRYGALLPTMLVSNLAIQELTEYVGERVLDRMKENGGALVTFNWGSQRGVRA